MLTGGRLAAGLLMMLAMIGAMVTFLADVGYDRVDWVRPILAAAAIGFVAGWQQLGGNLGREFLLSGLFGIGAALVALVFFALIFGMRSAYITHFSVQFDQAIDIIAHIFDVGLRVIQAVYTSPRTAASLVIGALCAGVIAEFLNRVWR